MFKKIVPAILLTTLTAFTHPAAASPADTVIQLEPITIKVPPRTEIEMEEQTVEVTLPTELRFEESDGGKIKVETRKAPKAKPAPRRLVSDDGEIILAALVAALDQAVPTTKIVASAMPTDVVDEMIEAHEASIKETPPARECAGHWHVDDTTSEFKTWCYARE